MLLRLRLLCVGSLCVLCFVVFVVLLFFSFHVVSARFGMSRIAPIPRHVVWFVVAVCLVLFVFVVLRVGVVCCLRCCVCMCGVLRVVLVLLCCVLCGGVRVLCWCV